MSAAGAGEKCPTCGGQSRAIRPLVWRNNALLAEQCRDAWHESASVAPGPSAKPEHVCKPSCHNPCLLDDEKPRRLGAAPTKPPTELLMDRLLKAVHIVRGMGRVDHGELVAHFKEILADFSIGAAAPSAEGTPKPDESLNEDLVALQAAERAFIILEKNYQHRFPMAQKMVQDAIARIARAGVGTDAPKQKFGDFLKDKVMLYLDPDLDVPFGQKEPTLVGPPDRMETAKEIMRAGTDADTP